MGSSMVVPHTVYYITVAFFALQQRISPYNFVKFNVFRDKVLLCAVSANWKGFGNARQDA
jgi:hypothetical protein